MGVLHACLYYVLVVDRQLWEVQAQGPFKERCLDALQHHYMASKMNFELYNYGYLQGYPQPAPRAVSALPLPPALLKTGLPPLYQPAHFAAPPTSPLHLPHQKQ